ncbi:MAG: hypothetical protein CMO26_11535 [Thiotrichales bacterium]|nr:hypothetical protein [Thiotrichales bacterium]
MNESSPKFQLLFPTVVQMTLIEGHQALNADLNREFDRIRRETPNGRPQAWSSEVYTTIGSDYLLHQRPAFARLADLFVEQATRYGQTLDYPMERYGIHIDMCWLNAYTHGHSQERHTHINYVFGGIYYLKAPTGASKLVVHSPTADAVLVPDYAERTDLNTSFVEIEPKEGIMLIFQGNLRHGVKASEIPAERVSISMNANLVQRGA